jgi:regulator of protease activity HflC (stomatin/prohibitin superfamily)
MKGPGLFFIVPIVDTVPYWIDIRVITSSFKAEKTLTKDTVPVNVDAVLFWRVLDPQKAALDVADYQTAISWAAQTALRDVIGKTMLSDMLEAGKESAMNFAKSSMSVPSLGASTSFRSSSRMFLSRRA